MRIAVDATCWLLPRGFGRHTRCLLRALHQVDSGSDYTLFTDDRDAVGALSAIGNVRLIPASATTLSAAARKKSRRLLDMLTMGRALADRTFDLVLFPTLYSYVPVFTRARKVVMMHDVTAEQYPKLALDGLRARLLWKAKVAFARRQADVIATVSEYSQRRIAQHFRLDPAQLHVIGEASDPVFRVMDQPSLPPKLTSAGIKAGRRLVVYVGGFSPHKNLPMLVERFRALAADPTFSDVDLVLVGEFAAETFHTCYSQIRQMVVRAQLDERVIFTGFLPDAELVALLNIAQVLVLPSVAEGFGLPAIEAAACGCPVIATKESPLPELLGEGGIYIDPADPTELEDALRDVLTSPARRAAMRQAAIAAASRLSWTTAARALVDLMQRTIAE